MTAEELAAMQDAAAQAEAEEKRRPLSSSEVQEMLVRQQINTIAVDDQTALRMHIYYPTFSELVGQTVKTSTEYSITKAYILIGNIDTYNYEDGFLSLYNIAKLNKFKTAHIIASCFDAATLPGTMYFRTSTDTTSPSSITAENEVRVDTATDTEYTLPITVNTKALKFFIRGNRFRGYIKKIWLEK